MMKLSFSTAEAFFPRSDCITFRAYGFLGLAVLPDYPPPHDKAHISPDTSQFDLTWFIIVGGGAWVGVISGPMTL